MGEGRLNADSRSALHAERTSAAAPLIAASRTPSVTSCRRIRPRLAPSALRTPISRCRSDGARQQQSRDVEARNQQHDPDHRQPDPRDPRQPRSSGTPSLTGMKRDAAAGVGLRVRQRELTHDAAEIGLCLRRRDARLSCGRRASATPRRARSAPAKARAGRGGRGAATGRARRDRRVPGIPRAITPAIENSRPFSDSVRPAIGARRRAAPSRSAR